MPTTPVITKEFLQTLDEVHTIVDGFDSKLALKPQTISAPVHVCLALVQIAAIAGVCFLAATVKPLAACIAGVSILAFAFFATKLTKV